MSDTNFLITFAKHGAEADLEVVSILNALSNDEREKERGSYYGSLSSLLRHVLGGTVYLTHLCKDALKGNSAAAKALDELCALPRPPEGSLTESAFANLAADLAKADSAFLKLVEALKESDLKAHVKTNIFTGKDAEYEVSFLLNNVMVHGIHHRGQISQILDELKIENNYSGLPLPS